MERVLLRLGGKPGYDTFMKVEEKGWLGVPSVGTWDSVEGLVAEGIRDYSQPCFSILEEEKPDCGCRR